MLSRRPDAADFRLHLILVDDDPVFGCLMVKTAESMGIRLSFLDKVERLRKVSWNNVDALLVDHELQKISGVQVISLLEQRFGRKNLPAFLISSNRRIRGIESTPLAPRFITKSEGALSLLREVLYRLDALHNSIATPEGSKMR